MGFLYRHSQISAQGPTALQKEDPKGNPWAFLYDPSQKVSPEDIN